MTLSAVTLAVECDLKVAGLEYERRELIRFIDANAGFVVADPDPAVWARRFAAMAREGPGTLGAIAWPTSRNQGSATLTKRGRSDSSVWR